MSFWVTSKGIRCRPTWKFAPLFDATQEQPSNTPKLHKSNGQIRPENGGRTPRISSRGDIDRLLPNGIESVLDHSLLAPLLTIGGVALGSGTFLETDLFSRPVNSSILCALVSEQPRWLEGLVDAPVQPLRDEQDRRVTALGKTRPRDIRAQIQAIKNDRDAFFGDAVVRDPSAVASFDANVRQWQRLLCPTLVIENPPPGSIERAAARSGGSLLAVYSDAAVQRLLASTKRGGLDFDAFSRAWQCKSPQTVLLQESSVASPVRPQISGLFLLSESSLARLACSSDPMIRGFFDSLIIVAPDQVASGSSSACSELSLLPDVWCPLMVSLILNCGQQQRLTLSGAAKAALTNYKVEIEGLHSKHCRLSRHSLLLATKVCQIIHAWTSQSATQIPEATMLRAVAKTKELILQSDATVNQFVASDRKIEASEQEARMLAKLHAHGALSERDLQRKYKRLPMEELKETRDRLFENHQARRRDDGLIEAVRQTGSVGS